MSAQRVTAGEPGIVRIDSHHAVAQTVERLEALLKERGIQIFAHFDFTADAARTDLTMRPEQLLIFGSPKAGTPLMQAQPTVGLDLPLKASYLGRRRRSRNDSLQRSAVRAAAPRGLPATLSGNIAGVIPLLERAARE